MLAQEFQCALGVAIHKDAYEFDDIFIFKNQIETFLHHGLAFILFDCGSIDEDLIQRGQFRGILRLEERRAISQLSL